MSCSPQRTELCLDQAAQLEAPAVAAVGPAVQADSCPGAVPCRVGQHSPGPSARAGDPLAAEPWLSPAPSPGQRH